MTQSTSAADKAQQAPAVFTAEQIAARVAQLAGEIVAKMPREFVIVALMKGGFIFTADLLREMQKRGCRPEVDFMTTSSYGNDMESSGRVTVLADIALDVAGREVLVIDDILESGRTLAHARTILTGRGAKKVLTCVLLDKPKKRLVEIEADFAGFECPDKFVVGYGMDYANRFRELPFIGAIEREK